MTRPAPNPRPQINYALCIAAVDCGVQSWWWDGQARNVHEFRLAFELLEEAGVDGRRRVLTKRYRMTLHPRSRLARDLKSWTEQPPDQRTSRYDWRQLLGRPAILTLEWSECGRWRRIAAIGRSWVEAKPDHQPLLLLLDERFDPDAFTRLPEALRHRIRASRTYLHLMGEQPDFPTEHVREATAAELLGDEIPW